MRPSSARIAGSVGPPCQSAPAVPSWRSRRRRRFEAALTALAMKPPAANPSRRKKRFPTAPFEGKRSSAAGATAAVRPAKPVDAASCHGAACILPQLADVPLPRPRPPLTPAQELGLEGKERAKAEHCLARRSISRRATSRCAARSRSRRSCSTACSRRTIRATCAAWCIRTRTAAWPASSPSPATAFPTSSARRVPGAARRRIAKQALDFAGLAARRRQVDALSRHLRAAELDPRDEEDGQARPAHLLSPAPLGRRLGRSGLGRRLADALTTHKTKTSKN